jgi:outer membrane protein TolC
MTFAEAIERAVASHPTIEQAAAGILRAEAVLQQVGARSRPSIDASVSTRTIGPVQQFAGESINPRTQLTAGVNLAVPLLTPARWAQRAQARDQVLVAERGADDAAGDRRGCGRSVPGGDRPAARAGAERARARPRAGALRLRQRRFEGGLGSRLNALRAQQELSSVDARVEAAQLGVWRAQEALGVLVGSDGLVDATNEPAFEAPVVVDAGAAAAVRSDVRLAVARTAAAERVVADAWKDRLPEVTAVVSPQLLHPTGLFAPARSWSAGLLFSVPLFDSGLRSGMARERQALRDVGARRAAGRRAAGAFRDPDRAGCRARDRARARGARGRPRRPARC